jgi:general secretion pathway protein I
VSRTRAFTLIEVLVALAIASIGLAAALAVVTNSARNVNYLRDKTLASWIAINRITTVHLGMQMPSVDKTDGDLDFANDKWKWVQTVTQTEVPGMRRIDVAVRRAGDPDDAPIATVSGFVGRTEVQSQPSSASWEYSAALPPGAQHPP